ncbi:ABC transporter permease subunit [Roseomonas sp. OT10]|uniref:ABC transporter permease subunit n=1 Tax=Roseomonas cutis TaxID=2897332 RepID=UPI001E62A3EC|nr:ABC transporter permease subunit [Roseomonas sp. OT10]UFN48519.1 ABC transporter permease subunit [Roseomonas sp. OT10]
MEELARHFLNGEALWRARIVLGEGALGTLRLGLAVLVLAPLAGALVFVLSSLPSRLLRAALEWYVDVMRALPLLVLLVLSYYVLLPLLGLSIDPFVASAVAFALKHGASFAEIYRAGFLGLDRGQRLAADAMGLSPWQRLRHVVLPQVALIMLPSLTSQATLVLRDLPLAFVIGYFEILTSARAAQVFTRNSTPLVGAVAAYAVLLLLLQWAASHAERFARRRMEA